MSERNNINSSNKLTRCLGIIVKIHNKNYRSKIKSKYMKKYVKSMDENVKFSKDTKFFQVSP